MKNLKTLLIIASVFAAASAAQAASHAGAPMATASAATSPKSEPSMTDGEIRKVDLESKKITIKHGEIKNLDMPGMTMVFQVKDPAMLDKVKAGDKVKFSAEKSGGAIVVTDIRPAK
jgi:Cu/Ag efflux protein CusF